MLRSPLARALLLLALGLIAGSHSPAAAEDKLTVYTYESFTAEWGPGPQVEKAFEAKCGCDLEFVSVADGVALLNRVRLEGKDTKADIVLGLDTNLTAEAAATGLFVPHGVDASGLSVPGGWSDPVFLPYDYGYFAVENKVHMHDLHATMLHLLGLDHAKLTYRYAGRDFRLTDVAGHVVKDIIA